MAQGDDGVQLGGLVSRVESKQQACQEIMQAINEGKLLHPVAARFPLEQLAEAHEAVESGEYIGNVVVEIGNEPV